MMSLVGKAQTFLEASGYEVNTRSGGNGILIAEKPDLGGLPSITCVGIVESPPESSAQHQVIDRFDRISGEFPNATLKFLSGTGAGGYQAHIREELRERKIPILPPAFFFDTLFKYDSNRQAASIVKDLADRGGGQESERVKQPFRLSSGEQEEDLAEYLLQHVKRQSFADSPSPMLWVVSAPAGYGKSIMFTSLFHKVYQEFQRAKREQRPFPRPLPMIAEHLRFSAGPNIKGLIDAFVQTDFAGHTPPELFTWMIDNGHGFWMIDGLDEVIAGDDDFLEFLLDRLTHPASAPLILMALRDSLLQSREELHELIEMGGDVVHSVELLPWQLEQKRRFVWIKAHGRLPDERESDDPEVQSLLGSLTKDRVVDGLSSTPFYADMLANEFLQDSSLSPQSEFDLLDLAVSAMCRREYAKEGPIQENVLSLESFREWLEEVAAEVVGQGGLSRKKPRFRGTGSGRIFVSCDVRCHVLLPS